MFTIIKNDASASSLCRENAYAPQQSLFSQENKLFFYDFFRLRWQNA